MKRKKLAVLAAIIAVIMVGAVSASFAAAEWKTPADTLAGLTGRSADEIQADRQAGTPYGAQALDAEQLEAFKAARLEEIKARLAEAVAAGDLTQEEADDRYEAMVDRQAACTGDGTGAGAGFGGGMRQGTGRGAGTGTGLGMGRGGRGMGQGNGVCNGSGLTNGN